jgi:hypothetical protein
MRAKSIKGNSNEEIRDSLKVACEDSFKPTLAIVFLSIRQDRHFVRQLLRDSGIDVFGATSCGEFTDGYQGEGSTAILLLDIPRENYALDLHVIGDGSMKEAGIHLAEKAGKLFNKPSIVLCSSRMSMEGGIFDGVSFVKGVNEILGNDIALFGGMAGDDMTFTGSYVFTHEEETNNGYIALILNAEKISVQGLAITGWQPMGISRTVTKSQGNMIYTIDDKPAVEMYLQYLGKQANAGDHSVDFMNSVSLNYPFIVERESGGTFLHTPLKIDEKAQALEIDVPMPPGSQFWFSVPPDFDIVDEVINEAASISNGEEADALLVFSCAGRINVLGPLVQSENEGLHELWKAPMAGFFTYGEFGRDQKNNNEFHSGACCWVALKEK